MSAYAALVSLRRTLGSTLEHGGLRIVRIRGELRDLHEKVTFLLDFLDNSFTYKATQDQKSALETMMRETAYETEDLIEAPKSRDLDLESRSLLDLTKITFRYFLFTLVVSFVSSGRIPVRFLRVIIMFGVSVGGLAAVPMCAICGVVLHLAFRPDDFPTLNDFTQQKTLDLRRVLNDFSNIKNEVVQIKEAIGQEMSAQEELISLQQLLDSALDSGRNRAQLESLKGKVTSLLDFLANASNYEPTRISVVRILDAKIRVAARRAKALVKVPTPAQSTQDSSVWTNFREFMQVSLFASLSSLPPLAMLTIIMLFFMEYQLISASFPQLLPIVTRLLLGWFIAVAHGFCALVLGTSGSQVVFLAKETTDDSEVQDNHALGRVIYNLNNILRDADEIKNAWENPTNMPAAAAASSRGSVKNVVVGLESDMILIRDFLDRPSPMLEAITIVGMGGIGKTTLAREVYNDPDFAHCFDVRAWVTISPEYSRHNVLLGLLDSAKIFFPKKLLGDSDDRLGEHLYRNLKGRRYLIVMDDVWDAEIWDTMRNFFPDEGNRSRVILTSRLSDVATHLGSDSHLHEMRCLDENKSWDLLREKIFGVEGCPSELESIGRGIARNCRGLPLAIVVTGGLLYKDKQREIWRDVAKNLNSILGETEEKYLEILGLSYNRLPHHLRPCFLYMGVFLRDSEIPVSRLISLWVAEGFLKPCTTSKTLEEVAQDYLNELIDRNLILAGKQSCNGKIKTCSIHDQLRNVCVQNARKERFLQVVDLGGCVRPDENPRRLSIHPDVLQDKAGHHDLVSSYDSLRSFLLCIGSKPIKESSVVYLGFMRLLVLDVLAVHFVKFPDQIIGLLCLRYLALHYDGPLPSLIVKLQNLQTIVHHLSLSCNHPYLPREIWRMPSLRNLYVKPGCYLFDPLPWKSIVLEHLQTLMGIRNLRWSKNISKRIPNLKKLGISYDLPSSVHWSEYKLESLANLCQLESLKIIIKYNDAGSHDPPKLAFPRTLKKLSLSGGGIPWTSMTTIGALPNLEVLKLRCKAFSGESWATVEEEFPQLVFLLLEDISFSSWETEAEHFPRLQRVVIRSCGMLQEIPYAVGFISTLELIHLVDGHPTAVASAQKIRRKQKKKGNEVLQVQIS